MSKYVGKIITNQAPAGYSVAFDGTGDYLQTPAVLLSSSSPFTFECWAYWNSTGDSTNMGMLTSQYVSAVSGRMLFGSQSGALVLRVNGGTIYLTAPINAYTWYHVAWTYDGTTHRLFLNGALLNTSTTVPSLYTGTNTSIGGQSDTNLSGYKINGFISNVRISSTTALYTTNFTPPTQLFPITNTSLLTCQSPTIVDNSANNYTITTNGNAAVSTFTPFAAYTPYNPALGASTPGVWTLDEAMQAAATRQWNMYDPSFQNTTLLLHGNGTNGAQNNTFLDSSSNNFTITRNGNTTQGSFSPFSQTGWSNYFDGSGDFLSFTNNANTNLGTGDFTVEAWVYLTAGNNFQMLFAPGPSTSGSLINYFSLAWGATTDVFGLTASNGVQSFSGTATTPINRWAHVAFVRISGTLYFYINGVAAGSGAFASAWGASTGTATIGYSASYPGQYYLNGYLSNFRVIKDAGIYTGNFTPPTAPLTAITNTSLLTCQSNRFIDNSTNNFTLTVNGNTSVQAFSPFYPTTAYTPQTIGGSGYFDGTGDSLEIADNTAFTLDGDFTIEGWLYPFSVADSDNFIGKWQPSNQEYLFWPESGVPKFYWAPNSAVTALLTSSVSIPTNAWTHLAVTRSGNSFTMWVNGVSRATATNSSAVTNTSSPVEIGRLSQYPPNYDYQGYMAGVRIVKGTAVYTTGFTPPTSPVTAITNTSLLLNFTNAGIVDSTAKNVLETVGNAQISTTQSKFGGSSMYFDGTGDYLTSNTATTDLYAFGSGDFTIECWVYLNSVVGYGIIYDGRPTTAQTTQPTLFHSGGTIAYYTNGANRIVGSALSTSTWYHIALARSGTSTKLFVDGTQVGSTYTDSTVYTNTSGRPWIGADSYSIGNNLLNGYIDDLRVTKGFARYTANFTPQTSQWQDR